MKLALTSAAAVAAVLVAAAPASASAFLLNGGAAITVPPSRSFAPTQCFSGSAGACGVLDQTDTTTAQGSTYTSTYYFQLGSALTLTSSNLSNTGNGVNFDGGTGSTVLYYDGTAGFGTGTTGGRPYVLTTSGSNSTENLTPDMILQTGYYRVVSTATLLDSATTVTSNFTFRAAPAPEPATWGLMVLGFGAIGAALRTSRRKVVFA